MAYFICPDCSGSFSARVYNVSQGQTGCGCVKHKTQTNVTKFLQEEYEKVESEVCILGRKRMDILLRNQKTYVEVDGDQHFRDIKYWKSDWKTVHANDCQKIREALNQGRSVIRIYQPTAFSESTDWRTYIKEALELIERKGVPILVVPSIEQYSIFVDSFSRECYQL